MNEESEIRVDLPLKYLKVIREEAERISEIERIVLFGSRAMNTAKKGSDIDLAIIGTEISHATKLKLYDRLNYETRIPFFIDVVDYNTIQNQALLDHIDQYGVIIYQYN